MVVPIIKPTTQYNQENARMSPDPSLRGVGSGHETREGLKDFIT